MCLWSCSSAVCAAGGGGVGGGCEDYMVVILSGLGDYEQFLLLTFSCLSNSLQNHKAD